MNKRPPRNEPREDKVVEVGEFPPGMAKSFFDLVQGADGLGSKGSQGFTGVVDPWDETEVASDWELVMSPGGRVLEIFFQGTKVGRVSKASLENDAETFIPKLVLEIAGPIQVSVKGKRKR